MKVVYVIRSLGHFSYYESIIRSLCHRGHRVELLFVPSDKKNEHKASYYSEEAVQNCASRTPGLQVGWALRRRGRGRRALFACRELRTYASYLRRSDQSAFYLQRWERLLPPSLQRAVGRRALRRILAQPWTQPCFDVVERAWPADAALKDQLAKACPDVVVAGPANLPYSEELEYVKAAKALGIPTVVPVLSWDNLTTKGLFHVAPDLMLVWNRAHFNEAQRIHGMPAERLVITGSPFFDKWFVRERSASDREAFFAEMGLDPRKPFLLYLGSSSNISQDETWVVRELAAALARDARADVRDVALLIRPHPAHWQIYRPLAAEGLRIWPAEGALPDSAEVIQDFHDMLCYSVAAVGLNTSAMIDAVIADVPTISVLPPCYTSTQEEAIHFQCLRDAGVFYLADGAAAAVDKLAALMRGADSREAQRRRFVLDFVRPRGLERPAGEIAARAIELAAQRLNAKQIERELVTDDVRCTRAPVAA